MKTVRKEEEASEEWLERIGMTPLPSAASAAAVHTTNKGLPKDTGMLLVTNGFRREEKSDLQKGEMD